MVCFHSKKNFTLNYCERKYRIFRQFLKRPQLEVIVVAVEDKIFDQNCDGNWISERHKTMLCRYKILRLLFGIDMSCRKLLHVRYCGDADANYQSLLVSFTGGKFTCNIFAIEFYSELILKTTHYRFPSLRHRYIDNL